MNLSTMRRCVTLGAAATTLLVLPMPWAAPAHGSVDEHPEFQDQPSLAVADAPRFEASSNLFEVIATLHHGELSMQIDRYATNEPLLGAKVEVESGALKAFAKFSDDEGDYAINDSALLQALTKPGEHPLLITISDGKDNDLLQAVLKVKGVDASPAHQGDARGAAWLWASGTLAALMTAAVAWIIRPRRRMVERKRE
jgi:hypothetical protein